MICFVCFGDPTSPAANAYSLGILSLLVIVVGVLSCFGMFFVSMYKRSKKPSL